MLVYCYWAPKHTHTRIQKDRRNWPTGSSSDLPVVPNSNMCRCIRYPIKLTIVVYVLLFHLILLIAPYYALFTVYLFILCFFPDRSIKNHKSVLCVCLDITKCSLIYSVIYGIVVFYFMLFVVNSLQITLSKSISFVGRIDVMWATLFSIKKVYSTTESL